MGKFSQLSDTLAKGWGMVKLTPEQRESFVKYDPDVFLPVKGKWGLRGATTVLLRLAKKDAVRKALIAAWRNTAPKQLTQQVDLQ